jgi:rRNA-processing protein FCF1
MTIITDNSKVIYLLQQELEIEKALSDELANAMDCIIKELERLGVKANAPALERWKERRK